MVSAQDILAYQEISPFLLLKEIDRQTAIEGLCELGNQVPRLLRNLVDIGAKADNITRIISVLNDHIVGRIVSLLQEQMGRPPVPFCWLVMGSEGRMEQTLMRQPTKTTRDFIKTLKRIGNRPRRQNSTFAR